MNTSTLEEHNKLVDAGQEVLKQMHQLHLEKEVLRLRLTQLTDLVMIAVRVARNPALMWNEGRCDWEEYEGIKWARTNLTDIIDTLEATIDSYSS